MLHALLLLSSSAAPHTNATAKVLSISFSLVVKEWIQFVNKIPPLIYASYPVSCIDCGSKEHLRYRVQYRLILANSNNNDKLNNARLGVLQFVILVGVCEILRHILDMKIHDDPFEMISSTYLYFLPNFFSTMTH